MSSLVILYIGIEFILEAPLLHGILVDYLCLNEFLVSAKQQM